MRYEHEQTATNMIAQKDRSPSRIETDVSAVKQMTDRIERTTERIIRHAHTLGYFQPPKSEAAAAPTPVVTTLADALQALDRAIDYCSGSLNVFE